MTLPLWIVAVSMAWKVFTPELFALYDVYKDIKGQIAWKMYLRKKKK